MPRAKAAPSRKRPLQEEEEQVSFSAALAAHEDVVLAVHEAAEISNLKERIASGSLPSIGSEGNISASAPDGLARLNAIAAEDFTTFTALHATICEKLGSGLTGWGGVSDKSGRLRGYGYLPSSPLAEAHFSESHVMKEYVGDEATKDRLANRRASIQLEQADLPAGFDAALGRLLDALRPLLPERYRQFATAAQLVAAQPNLHRGKAYLRPHLDEPLHDGFGVLIVTLAIAGDATILIRPKQPREAADAGGTEDAGADVKGAADAGVGSGAGSERGDVCFPLRRGEGYALSGDARNVCLHGVLADGESAQRESLNLRFGLHAKQRDAEFSAWSEVDRHWEEADARGQA